MNNLRHLACLAAFASLALAGASHAQVQPVASVESHTSPSIALTNAGSLDSDIVDAMAKDLQASFTRGEPANCASIKLDRMSPVDDGVQMRNIWCYVPSHPAQAAWIWGEHHQRLKSGAYASPASFVRYVSRNEVIDLRYMNKLDDAKREEIVREMQAVGDAANKARSRGHDRTIELIFTVVRVLGGVH